MSIESYPTSTSPDTTPTQEIKIPGARPETPADDVDTKPIEIVDVPVSLPESPVQPEQTGKPPLTSADMPGSPLPKQESTREGKFGIPPVRYEPGEFKGDPRRVPGHPSNPATGIRFESPNELSK